MGNLIIYTSSAGSGKTFTLAKEYLKIVLKNPGDIKSVLAVTFTNKSTEEMKSRIIQYLQYFAGKKVNLNDGEGMKKALLDSDVTLNEINNANEVLSYILHNYSDFYVMTIDSFFSQVVKSFAKELKLPSGFDYEIDESVVKSEILKNMWKESISDKVLLDYLIDLMKTKLYDGRSFKIDDDIMNISGELFKDRFWKIMMSGGQRDKIFQTDEFKSKISQVFNYCIECRRGFEKVYKEKATEAIKFMQSIDLGVTDFLKGNRGGAYNKLEKIISGDLSDFKSTYISGLEGKLYPQSSSKIEIMESNKFEIISHLKNVYDYYNKEIIKYNTCELIMKNLKLTGLFANLYKNLLEYKEANSVLLISDVTRIIRQFVDVNNSFTPFIFEKFGSNFKYILIDEFQDTSDFQWDNLKPLVQNSLAENHTSLVVGDAKQSIYRFRNGNMELLVKGIKDDINKESIIEKNLSENHRSLKNIVKFNNELFTKITEIKTLYLDSNKKIFDETYKNVVQGYSEESDSGYVNISQVLQSKSKSEFQEVALNRMLDFIRDIQDKYISKNIYKWSDITILLKENKEAATVAGFLVSEGFDVVSANSLSLASSPNVKLIINVLKLISDRTNDIAKTEIEYHYLKKILKDKDTELKIFSPSVLEPGTLFNIEMPKGLMREGSKKELNTKLYDLNTPELVEYIADVFGLNKKSDMFLITFIEQVRKHSEQFSGDLISFLLWWEENGSDILIETEMNENAILIQTIHKMKGLQNKIIIIPFANWSILPKPNSLLLTSLSDIPFDSVPFYLLYMVKNLEKSLFKEVYLDELDKTLIDNINLLYVAFTRPKEMLYVITQGLSSEESDNKPKENDSSLISKIIRDALIDKTFNKVNDEILEYTFGTNDFAINREPSEEKLTNDEIINETIYNDWYKKVVVKPKNYGIKPWEDKYEDVSYGNTFHEILSNIIYKEDAEKVLEDASRNGILSKERFSIMRDEIDKLLNDETVSEWFTKDWEILTERDIITPEGNIYRPDRVILKGSKAIVIDYKTGKEKKEYKNQITNYAKLIESLGYTEVEKYILYLNQSENKIVKVN